MRMSEDTWKELHPIANIDNDFENRRRLLQMGGLPSARTMQGYYFAIVMRFYEVAKACYIPQ